MAVARVIAVLQLMAKEMAKNCVDCFRQFHPYEPETEFKSQMGEAKRFGNYSWSTMVAELMLSMGSLVVALCIDGVFRR